MSNLDGPNSEFVDDDEVQVTDLDPLHSRQHRRAARISGAVRKSLSISWLRYSLFGTLILVLLGALILQWPRPVLTTQPTQTTRSAPSFLSASVAPGMIFLQTTDHTLLARETATGRPLWHSTLPAAATIMVLNQILVSAYIAPGRNKTELQALNARTGKLIWHDELPAAQPGFAIGQFQASGIQSIQEPGITHDDTALYIQSISDAIYSIQISNGHTNWIYQAQNAKRISPSAYPPEVLLTVRDGVVEFMSADYTAHFLDASDGHEIIHFTATSDYPFVPTVDGQMLYVLPPPGNGAAIQVFHIPDGQLLWTYPLPKGTWAQMEVNGIVYLGAAAGATIIALRGNDGQHLWTYHSSDGQPVVNASSDGQPVVNALSPTQDSDYLLQQDDTLVRIRASDGHVLWRKQLTALKNQLGQSTSLFVDNDTILLYNIQPNATVPLYALSASDGQLLWQSAEPVTNPIPNAGILYTMQNNGQLDAWRESDGQHLWGHSFLIGSSMHLDRTNQSSVLFVMSTLGTLYVLRTSDGKILWQYP